MEVDNEYEEFMKKYQKMELNPECSDDELDEEHDDPPTYEIVIPTDHRCNKGCNGLEDMVVYTNPEYTSLKHVDYFDREDHFHVVGNNGVLIKSVSVDFRIMSRDDDELYDYVCEKAKRLIATKFRNSEPLDEFTAPYWFARHFLTVTIKRIKKSACDPMKMKPITVNLKTDGFINANSRLYIRDLKSSNFEPYQDVLVNDLSLKGLKNGREINVVFEPSYKFKLTINDQETVLSLMERCVKEMWILQNEKYSDGYLREQSEWNSVNSLIVEVQWVPLKNTLIICAE